MSNVTKSRKKFSSDLETATLNQVWLLYQVSLNQMKLTLQKPTKIWDKSSGSPKGGKPKPKPKPKITIYFSRSRIRRLPKSISEVRSFYLCCLKIQTLAKKEKK